MVDKNKYNYQILSKDYEKYDMSFKVLILGNAETGKSKIALRINNNKYDDIYDKTIGFEFFSFNIKINNTVVKIQIWDTCGAELYRSLILNF